jgi:shikimate 5-dehydrogenase
MTDWIGIRSCIKRGLSPANTIRPQSSAIVCGAGGMARSAIYALLSLGVKHIFVCNRTFEYAEALCKHYNDHIQAGAIPVLDINDEGMPHVRALDSFDAPWPKDTRQPTIVVSCIPRQIANQPPINFIVPDGWLKSPTGGVVLEVRCLSTFEQSAL